MTADSNKGATGRKPSKLDPNWRIQRGLHPQFPLFPHQSGRWAKKVHKRLRYFGKIADDPKGQQALDLWNEQKDDLLANRRPRKADGLSLAELCNKFLASKRPDVDSERLSPRTFVEYCRTCDLLVSVFGKNRPVADFHPQDFETLYRRFTRQHKTGVTRLGREITMVRSVFKYGVEAGLIDHIVRFGPKFKVPSKADKRKARAKKKQRYGARMFSADEIRSMLDSAGPQLKAMILLGINGGLGNNDCAMLPLSALDSDRAWIDFPRIKSGVERKFPIWRETMEALRAVIAKRPNAKKPEHAGLVFLTRLGQPWVRYELIETTNASGKIVVSGKGDDAIAKETRKLLNDLGIYRPGVTFYALRHTFETIAGASRDQVAVDAVMGHVDASMAAEYRENLEDERLKAVVEHVRKWLFADQEHAKAKRPKKTRAYEPQPNKNKESAQLRIVG